MTPCRALYNQWFTFTGSSIHASFPGRVQVRFCHAFSASEHDLYLNHHGLPFSCLYLISSSVALLTACSSITILLFPHLYTLASKIQVLHVLKLILILLSTHKAFLSYVLFLVENMFHVSVTAVFIRMKRFTFLLRLFSGITK